jgi:hypothetical protein
VPLRSIEIAGIPAESLDFPAIFSRNFRRNYGNRAEFHRNHRDLYFSEILAFFEIPAILALKRQEFLNFKV